MKIKVVIIIMSLMSLGLSALGQTKFTEYGRYKIEIPPAYSVDAFIHNNKTEFYKIHRQIREKNFNNSSLVTGEKTLYVYKVKNGTTDQIRKFIKKKSGRFPNAQVLTIAWLQIWNSLPSEKIILGLDERSNLLFYEGCYNAVALYRDGTLWYLSLECSDYGDATKLWEEVYFVFYK